MANKNLRFFLFAIVLFALGFKVYGVGPYYWILKNSKQDYRHFLQVSSEGKYFKVLELEQERGDFPYILSRKEFSDSESLHTYLNAFRTLKAKELSHLEDWVTSKHLSKALKKNSNIWVATEQWSDAWEEEMAKWVTENVKEDFFVKYNLATDCADAILAVRWIFARIHGLPVANHISVSQSLFTNYSLPRKWRKIPKARLWHQDQLFRTALNYVMATGSTTTVLQDSYPLALTKRGLLVGAYSIIRNPDSNHAKLITENHFDDPTELPLFTLASTVPRRVRYLVREPVIDQGWPVKGQKSFLNFRWPIVSGTSVYLRSAPSHSDYSLEQYDPSLRQQYPRFIDFLLKRLNTNYDPQHLVELAVEDIINYTQQRIQIVAEGAAFCQSHDCSPGTANWEDWSTPSRDKKLKAKFTNFDALVKNFEVDHPGLSEKWRRAQLDNKLAILGYDLSLKTIRYLLESGKASSNPNVSLEQRWGLDIDDTAHDLVLSTLHLLEKRKLTLEKQNQSCSPTNCFAKTTNWLAWNTYKIDEQLLSNYRDFKKLCVIYATDTCFDLIFDNSTTFDSGSESLLLKQWVNRIPLFHSEPSVSRDRRWGSLGKPYSTTQIDFELDVTFSQENTVLVDSRRFLDLPSGRTLLSAKEDEELSLSKSGALLVQKGVRKDHFEIGLKAANGDLSYRVMESFTPVNDMSWNVRRFYHSVDFSAVTFASIDQRRTFIVVFDKEGKKLLGPVLCNPAKKSDSIFIPSLMKMISFENNLIRTLSQQAIAAFGIKKIKVFNLSPVSLTSDKILFDYYDDIYGVQYPLYLYQDRVITLGLDNRKNVDLKSFELAEELFFIVYKETEEYPKAYVVKGGNSLQYTQVGNSFERVVKTDDGYFFSTSTGSIWNPSREMILKKYHQGAVRTISVGDAQFRFSHLGIKGYFLSAQNVYTAGKYARYMGMKSAVAYPSFLRSDTQLCGNIYTMDDRYIEQLSYEHGDYSCFGAVYADEEKQNSIFSIKYRSQVKLEQNLTNYHSHTIEFLGENSIMWWGLK